MIEFSNVSKVYPNGVVGLDDVNLTIEQGEFVGIIGLSGAGKSTLIRHITGVYKPDAGEVLIAGEPVYENKKVKAKFSYIPDEIFYFMALFFLNITNIYIN